MHTNPVPKKNVVESQHECIITGIGVGNFAELLPHYKNKAGQGPATKQVGPLFSPKGCLGHILIQTFLVNQDSCFVSKTNGN